MKNKEKLVPFLVAVSLHIVIGVALVVGASFSLPKEKPPIATPIINASVVNQKLFDDLAERKNKKKLSEQRKKEALKQKEAKEKRDIKQAEEKRKEKAATARRSQKEKALKKKKEAERVKAEKLLVAKKIKEKKVADAKKKKADDKRKKQKIEQQKKLDKKQRQVKKKAQEKARKDAKIKAQRDAKIKADKKAKRILAAKKAAKKEAKRKADAKAEKLRQADLDKLMEAEFDNEFSSAQSAKQLSELARYKALIQDKISRNWQVDPSMKNKTCTLAIRLSAGGLVLSANRTKGNKRLCDSAKRATLKAKTLPIPKDPDIAVQFRDFDIKLTPSL